MQWIKIEVYQYLHDGVGCMIWLSTGYTRSVRMIFLCGEKDEDYTKP